MKLSFDIQKVQMRKSQRRRKGEFPSMNVQRHSGVSLSHLICKKKWPKVDRLIESLSESNVIGAIQIDERCIISPENILHFACRLCAPLATMYLLAAAFPQSVNHIDDTGRFALHIAVKYGAIPEVVEFLVLQNPKSACIQDNSGKTPMHYVGESYGRHYDSCAEIPLKKSILLVIKILKIVAPKSVILEDCDGYNAIELALESNADIKVIRSMQHASRDDWREMKAANGKTHEELLHDIERNVLEERMKRTNILSDFDTVGGLSMKCF